MNNRTQIIEDKIEKLEKLGDATIMLMELALAEGVNTLEAFTEVKALDSTLERIDEGISMLEQELEDDGCQCIEELERENEYLNDLLEEKQYEIDDWYDYAKELKSKIEKQSALISDTELKVEKTRKKLVFIQFKDMFKKNPNIKNHVAAKELGVTEETIIRLKCMLAA